MKVLLAVEGDRVAAHFGHAPSFLIAEIEDGKVKRTEFVPNPGHKPGFLPAYFSQMGITHVIAGGMGPRAQELFQAHGITTILGVQGAVEEVIQAFCDNRLVPGPSLCDHGQKGTHGGCGGRCGGHSS
ncbi:NifB/NifX family molybdenum-iron cluster-binding protein [Ammonifex thiophilus]|uniref:Dinitrogenase iron-molybdenum cofactor n=1 Tax=Ammonifex thiophilus TaxID=444093 RepID=A0A3D8P6Y9_9THEO|nr:NifB/NifX family molybdenum-iron cluster-binding protein [Ammonifex thiophilus]RDV84090.1 dinitrogenase iron-molybdenum cofactor [Ammonifex thiophilus]